MRQHTYSTDGRGRKVLAAMVMDKHVLSKVATAWPREGLFGEDVASNIVGGWCVQHYRKYSEAPEHTIQTTYEHWQEGADKDAAKLVASMLDACSRESERGLPSSQVMLDICQEHFNAVSLRQSIDAAQDELNRGNTYAAQGFVDTRKRVEFSDDSIFDPMEDYNDWVDALDDSGSEPLIRVPGVFGQFIQDDLVKDSFVAIMAASSQGKSWWLLDLAYLGVLSGSRVAYFEAGDLSRHQVIKRMAQRALKRPRKPSSVAWPVAFDGSIEGLECKPRKLRPPIAAKAIKRWKKAGKRRHKSFRLHASANSSISALDIYQKCMQWSEDGFKASVVVVDYMDILAPYPGENDKRERINESWKCMRRLSQDLNCLVLTVTQSDAASYDTELLRRSNFTDDRRKLDHLTGQLGLNSTDAEKAVGISRFNWLKRRNEAYTENEQVVVAGCLACGCPRLLSSYPRMAHDDDQEYEG